MGQTIIQKILAQGSGRASVNIGDFAVTDVDMTVILDLQFLEGRLDDIVAIPRPERVAIVMDHSVPAASARDAGAASAARKFAERHGIEQVVDVGRHGIVHQVIAESALARPGQVLACTDSHTCAAGALNVAGRGLGPAEIEQILCTGQTWYQVPPTIRYDFEGRLRPGVSGKDVFLHIAAAHGSAANCAVEFGGDISALAMNERRTIATQLAEIGADFGLFPADDACRSYLEATGGVEQIPEGIDADADAEYLRRTTIDLGEVEPMVGLPGGVIHNAVSASARSDVAIQQCFVGSCANGQLEDIKIAAEVIKGRTVAPGVRLIVTPASQKIYLEAVRAGYVETLVTAGAVVTNSTCGACFGYHMGVLGPGEVCITASTRNFRGRMGSPDAEIYMASPATVVASAVTGHIADARGLSGE